MKVKYYNFEDIEHANILLNYSLELDNMIKDAIACEKLLELCISLTEIYENAKHSCLDNGALLVIKNKRDLANYMYVITNKNSYDTMLINKEIQKELHSYNLEIVEDKVKFEFLKTYLINYN